MNEFGSGDQFQSALVPSHAPASGKRDRRDPWRDPLGLGADPGTIMGFRYRTAKYVLGQYLDINKKHGSESPDQSQDPTEGTTKEIVINDTENKDADSHTHKMKVAARRDILRMNLVILDDILTEFQFKSRHASSRGFGAFVIFNLIYQYERHAQHTGPIALDYLLMAFATASTGYALTTLSTCGLVLWCSRRAKMVLEKLNTERLAQSDRTALDGWWWGTLEWMAGFDGLPFM